VTDHAAVPVQNVNYDAKVILDHRAIADTVTVMSTTVPPVLATNSVFLRLAQRRYNLSRESLAVVAMELQKGTSLRSIAVLTGIRHAVIKSLTTLPWQTAVLTHPVPATRSSPMDALGGSLSTADKAAIKDLCRLKVKPADIAAYMRLPVALVRAYLK
jgi:hypothetical protein